MPLPPAPPGLRGTRQLVVYFRIHFQLDQVIQDHLVSRMDQCEATLSVVCLLASAGGLDPLLTFFKGVPSSSGIAYLVLQHHGRDQPRQLPTLLERQSAIPARLERLMS